MPVSNNSHPFPPGSLLVAYLRDSGGDEQDLSIDQQEQRIRAWCAENGLTLTQTFRDTRSGTSTVGRSGFEAMIRYFFQKASPPDEAGIILWRYNRFARDIDDAQYFKAGLRRKGFQIHSLNDPIPDGTTGRAVEFLIDWMSDKFSEDLSVEVRRGLHHLLEQYGGLPGFPPVGFKREPIDLGHRRSGERHIVHKWVPDPDVWETCRLAWKMRAEGASYKEIHEKTRLLGSINSYTTFYRNRIYLGELRYGDITVPEYFPALVDQVTWDAVQAISAERTKTTGANNANHPRRAASSFLLSGLLYCDLCGAPMSGYTVRPKDGKYIRSYYQCHNQQANWKCDAPRIPQDVIEPAVIEAVIEYILDPETLLAVQEESRRYYSEHQQEETARRAELATRLQSVRQRITNVTAAIEEAGHSNALLSRLAGLETEEATLKVDLNKIDQFLKSVPSNVSPQRFQRFSRAAQILLTNGDPETRRKTLRGFVDRIDAHRDGRLTSGVISCYQPPDELINSIADLPFDDISPPNGPDPPGKGLYAYVPDPRGGTRFGKTKNRSRFMRKM